MTSSAPPKAELTAEQQAVLSPGHFAVYASGESEEPWEWAPHLQLLDQLLVCLARGSAPVWLLRKVGVERLSGVDLSMLDDEDYMPFTRLLVSMPPRHGKSELISRHFPAWYLGSRPTKRVILCSYADSLARDFGAQARDLLELHGPKLWGVTVSDGASAASDWEVLADKATRVTRRGGMITAGVGGGITGHGAHMFIIDDPVKNAEEAGSETIQERNINWWRSTARTRLEPGASVLIVQTRWHESDLMGQLLADGAHGWVMLNLPALAESNDPLGRKADDPLWPARFDAAALADIRFGEVDPETKQRSGGIGSYFWNAMYQGHPAPVEGQLFKRGWWQWYDEIEAESINGYISIDTAGYDTKTRGDYAVIHTACRVGRNIYSRDLQRGHWEFPELMQRALDAQAMYGYPILVEDVPWAKPLIQMLRGRTSRVVPFAPGGHNKEARAAAVSPLIEGGNWYLPRGALWVNDFIEEHAAFPNGAHDDQVDTTSMIGLKLQLYGGPLPSTIRVRQPTLAKPRGAVGSWGFRG